MVKRSSGAPGRNLGRQTRWIHRSSLRMRKVEVVSGAAFERIGTEGVHIIDSEGKPKLIGADTVVLCTGQESKNMLVDQIRNSGRAPYAIGGAETASGIDAKRAIDQGNRLAASL